MDYELVKTFRFEAAHSLPNVPAGHKCSRMHGHGYRVDVHVSGEPDPRTGWVIDFGQIKQAVEGVLGALDHRCLNEIAGLENSTSEVLCKYLWDRIKPALPLLSAIEVWESDTSRCIYRG
ncbi:MAG: 6-carboxytetrahydropterin synthase QueD [Planctomycetaceae bacterium]|nr:6-carboxytetrahydropterin synthase QueD [Planctomycetaceae bacterium]